MPTPQTPVVEVFNLSEAATWLRIPEKVLLCLAEDGGLPARKVGEEWRFLKTALETWLYCDPRHDANGPSSPMAWLARLPHEWLLAELQRRLLDGRTPPEQTQDSPSSKQQILELAGCWKDDPTLEEMLEDIYKQRGRPMLEEG